MGSWFASPIQLLCWGDSRTGCLRGASGKRFFKSQQSSVQLAWRRYILSVTGRGNGGSEQRRAGQKTRPITIRNAAKNWERHPTSVPECEEVRSLFRTIENAEPRFYGLGQTDSDRSLFVVFTIRGALFA
jgi:hypothetical protein